MNENNISIDHAIREQHLGAVLRGIRNVNRLIITEDDPLRLIQRACESLTETMGYHNTWIALLGGDSGHALGLVEPGAVAATAAAGFHLDFQAFCAQLQQGSLPRCMVHALKTGDAIVTKDPQTECESCLLSGDYDERAGLARPLVCAGVTYGVMVASVPASFAQDIEEQQLFAELTDDLAFGLQKIAMARRQRANENELLATNQQLRAIEQQLTASNQQLTATNQQLRAIEQQLRASNQQLRATIQQLGDSEKRFRQVYEHVVTGIPRVSLDMRIEQANAAYCGMLGYTEAELVGLHLRDITVPEVLESNLNLQAQLIAGEIDHYRMEKAFVRKDHQIVHGILDASLVRTDTGEPAYCIGSVVDITERKRINELLLSERNRFHAVMETAPVALLVADHRECIVQANRAAKRLFGPLDDLTDLSLRCGDFIGCVHRRESPEGCGHGPACATCALYDALRSALAGKTLHDLETEIRVEKGSTSERRIILLHAAPLFTGEHTSAILAASDITEMRTLHVTMAQSDRLSSMGMLAAGVAHEINNPLSYVLYNLESINEDVPKFFSTRQDSHPSPMDPTPGEDILTRFKDALHGTYRIRDIARGLGTFSRVEKENAVSVNLMQVMDIAANMAANEIKYRARLIKDYSPIPNVLASEGRLSQVFLNLMINATHAIEEGNVENNAIFLRTWSENDRIFAEVRDTGSGIAPEHLDSLFEPFFTTKKLGKGSGLGLAISKNIIESYGGSISVESEPGRGTAFLIDLPVQQESVATTDQEIGLADPGTTICGRILIVDDEAGIRTAMARLLRGHEVVQAASGVEAKNLLRDDASFDLVLCDMMMPDLSGMELHQWLRDVHPDLADRLIFITGGAFTPRTAEYLSQINNLQLEKPFDIANFKKVIHQRLTQARKNRPL